MFNLKKPVENKTDLGRLVHSYLIYSFQSHCIVVEKVCIGLKLVAQLNEYVSYVLGRAPFIKPSC